eukprot:9662157-Heterocapsa_arctica.AAC.1
MNHTFYAPWQPDVVYGVVTAVGAPPPLLAVPTVGAPGTWGGEVQIPLHAGPPTPPKPPPP